MYSIRWCSQIHFVNPGIASVEVLHTIVMVLEIAPYDIQHSCPYWQIYLRWLHNSQQIYYVGNKTDLWTASCVHLFQMQFHYFCNTPYLDRNTLRYFSSATIQGRSGNVFWRCIAAIQICFESTMVSLHSYQLFKTVEVRTTSVSKGRNFRFQRQCLKWT